MPDLITHTIFVIPLSKRYPGSTQAVILLLGAILPDLLSRTITIVFANNYQLAWVGAAMHTPIILLLSIYSLAMLFTQRIRRGVFVCLLLGVTTHLALDALQKHYLPTYFWFFPLSYKSFEWGLFWPEDSLNFIASLFSHPLELVQ